MDLSTPIRKAIVTALRADAALLALVPAERIYGRKSPADSPYPFTRYGTPILEPFRASCINGTGGEVTIHAFAEGSSEDAADAIAAAIVDRLDDAVLPIGEDGETANLRWTGGQTVPDIDEPTIWHAYRTFAVDGIA